MNWLIGEHLPGYEARRLRPTSIQTRKAVDKCVPPNGSCGGWRVFVKVDSKQILLQRLSYERNNGSLVYNPLLRIHSLLTCPRHASGPMIFELITIVRRTINRTTRGDHYTWVPSHPTEGIPLAVYGWVSREGDPWYVWPPRRQPLLGAAERVDVTESEELQDMLRILRLEAQHSHTYLHGSSRSACRTNLQKATGRA